MSKEGQILSQTAEPGHSWRDQTLHSVLCNKFIEIPTIPAQHVWMPIKNTNQSSQNWTSFVFYPVLEWPEPCTLQFSSFNHHSCFVEDLDSHMSPLILIEWKDVTHTEAHAIPPDPITLSTGALTKQLEFASAVTRTWSLTSFPPVNTASYI